VHELAAQGVRRFVEVGPKSVLLGLCRTIEPSLSGLKFGEPADLEKVKLEFSPSGHTHSAASDSASV
jgi:malonyl CoA-acyl carrier protein transacylase